MVEWDPEAAEGGPAHKEPEMTVTHPQAGTAASNQFGTFQVHYATPAQFGYVKHLFATRVITDVPTAELRDELRGIYAQMQEGRISKKAASRAIDLLLPLPEHQVEAPANPASEKQIALITKLLGERDLGRDVDVASLTGGRGGSASALIDELFAAPKKVSGNRRGGWDAGMYLGSDDRIYRVYLGQQSGQMLVKEVVGDPEHGYAMEYLGLAAKHVPADARRMTLDEAKAWGKATGSCVKCGRRLDVPESVDAGIGPVCASKEW